MLQGFIVLGGERVTKAWFCTYACSGKFNLHRQIYRKYGRPVKKKLAVKEMW